MVVGFGKTACIHLSRFFVANGLDTVGLKFVVSSLLFAGYCLLSGSLSPLRLEA